MSVRARRSSAAAGFTLVELAVALALAALVSVILLYGMRFAAIGLDRLSARAEQIEERQSLEALLRRALGSVAAIPTFEGAASFVGGPASLKFLSLAEDAGPGLYRVELSLDTARADRPLLLRRRVASAIAVPRLQETILARNVSGFRIDYFGAISPGDEAAWQQRWDGLSYPPQLVRITLLTDGGLSRPPITIRLWNAGA